LRINTCQLLTNYKTFLDISNMSLDMVKYFLDIPTYQHTAELGRTFPRQTKHLLGHGRIRHRKSKRLHSRTIPRHSKHLPGHGRIFRDIANISQDVIEYFIDIENGSLDMVEHFIDIVIVSFDMVNMSHGKCLLGHGKHVHNKLVKLMYVVKAIKILRLPCHC
jgi:hypothetical protein